MFHIIFLLHQLLPYAAEETFKRRMIIILSQTQQKLNAVEKDWYLYSLFIKCIQQLTALEITAVNIISLGQTRTESTQWVI